MSALALHDLCVSFGDGDEQIAALDHVSAPPDRASRACSPLRAHCDHPTAAQS